ncbi:MAG TPA: hypothetical protein VEP69_01670 [Thermodesulfovibrionales bacterium]|nr:hypothetical protein [Thermodesulfovibrionales bacterium]
MKQFLLVLVPVILFTASGCTKSVRYSQDEIKDYPTQTQEYIRNSQVAVGMTRQQVRYSWGGPHAVSVLAPSRDSKERVEWIYKKMAFFKTRLIFTDDRLTEIINNEPGSTK